MSAVTVAALVIGIVGIDTLRRRQVQMLSNSNAYLRGKNQQLSMLLTESYIRTFNKSTPVETEDKS